MPKIVRVPDPTAPQLQLLTVKQEGRPIGTVAMCTRDRIASQTATSWMLSDYGLADGEIVSRFVVQGHILPMQRNECIKRMEGDWIIFIDDDMMWQPDAFKRLIATHREHQLDMVGGLCFQRSAPYQPTMYMRERPNDGRYVFLEHWDDGAVVEVDATGMAFVLITKRLLEAMAGEFPPYEERLRREPPEYFRWEGRLGEDLRFCQDVKATGTKIFVDTGVKIGHISEVEIDERSFLSQLVARTPEQVEAKRVRNDELGLVTVTQQMAMDRLNGLS